MVEKEHKAKSVGPTITFVTIKPKSDLLFASGFGLVFVSNFGLIVTKVIVGPTDFALCLYPNIFDLDQSDDNETPNIKMVEKEHKAKSVGPILAWALSPVLLDFSSLACSSSSRPTCFLPPALAWYKYF
jgi:hypothetical protein